MIITGICMFIAALPLRLAAMVVLKTSAGSGNSTILLMTTYIAVFLLFVPVIFGWLLDKVLKYSTPRIRQTLERKAFFAEKQ